MIETILTDLYFYLCCKYSKEDWMLIIPEHFSEWNHLCAKHLGLSFAESEEYKAFIKTYAPTCAY